MLILKSLIMIRFLKKEAIANKDLKKSKKSTLNPSNMTQQQNTKYSKETINKASQLIIFTKI